MSEKKDVKVTIRRDAYMVVKYDYTITCPFCNTSFGNTIESDVLKKMFIEKGEPPEKSSCCGATFEINPVDVVLDNADYTPEEGSVKLELELDVKAWR